MYKKCAYGIKTCAEHIRRRKLERNALLAQGVKNRFGGSWRAGVSWKRIWVEEEVSAGRFECLKTAGNGADGEVQVEFQTFDL